MLTKSQTKLVQHKLWSDVSCVSRRSTTALEGARNQSIKKWFERPETIAIYPTKDVSKKTHYDNMHRYLTWEVFLVFTLIYHQCTNCCDISELLSDMVLCFSCTQKLGIGDGLVLIGTSAQQEGIG